jgi:gamma-glutamyl hercynylcysteine S-oxide synthase
VASTDTNTKPRGGAEPVPRDSYAAALADARERTLALVAPVSQDDLDRVHSPLMSPLVWDLGHIAAFEDLWLGVRAGGLEPLRPDLMAVYDASETPRAERGVIPYLRRDDALEYMEQVRERALSVLADADLSPGSDRLNANGFVWDLLIQHEHQHNETMLQTLQLAEPGTFDPTTVADGRAVGTAKGDGEQIGAESARHESSGDASPAILDGGACEIGDPGKAFAYDNERPRHVVELAPFAIDRAPVTNGEYAEFVADGGYARLELWTPAGWAWREAEDAERPLYWTPDGRERRFNQIAQPAAGAPVMHVCCFEAEAYARWAGGRLPTEHEWEHAAVLLGRTHGNLDQLDFGPGVAGPFVGDCWEWTASEFSGYPGFSAFPYPEYSEVFFDAGYRVLRGASWATRPSVARATFRNWDHPQRRQIFCGFRCAYDTEGSE